METQKPYEFTWKGPAYTIHGTINEIIVDTESLKVCRYWTDPMKDGKGGLFYNPLVKFKKCAKGWKVYFLDSDYEAFDFPIFEEKGTNCKLFFGNVA